MQKAKRLGIEALTAKTAEDGIKKIQSITASLPVLISEILDVELETIAEFTPQTTGHIDPSKSTTIGGRHCQDWFADHVEKLLKSNTQPPAKGTIEFEDKSDLWICSIEGHRILLNEFQIKYSINKLTHYFGYVDQLPSAVKLSGSSDKKVQLFWNNNDFLSGFYKNQFIPFDDLKHVPQRGQQHLAILSIPDMSSDQGTIIKFQDITHQTRKRPPK